MTIRRLDPLLVDRIAAGEVIERPAAAVKELIENALDAGARAIEVAIEAGGQRLIRVIDDGRGMDEADLALCVERHATSKIPDGDLTAIATFGFRGEALPSIASSRGWRSARATAGAPTGLRLVVEDGTKSSAEPCAAAQGTRIEARDLFAATPARLKFLKTDRSRSAGRRRCGQAPGARPSRGALLALRANRRDLRLAGLPPAKRGRRGAAEPGARRRIRRQLADRRGRARGRAAAGGIGLPTFSRPTRWRNMSSSTAVRCATSRSPGAMRAAYMDFLPADRHRGPRAVRRMRAADVDVNVHPAKAEVRFRDAGLVRGLVVGALKQRLAAALHRAATTGGSATVLAMRPRRTSDRPRPPPDWDWRASPAAPAAAPGFAEAVAGALRRLRPRRAGRAAAEPSPRDLAAPLGAARAQVHETYIVAQTRDGVVIVDQHAAHERLVYETPQAPARGAGGVERQALLSPLVVDLDAGDAASLSKPCGLNSPRSASSSSASAPARSLVREAPAALAKGDIAGLVRDLAADLAAEDGAQSLAPPARPAPRDLRLPPFGALRPPLEPEEMNALLREMERRPAPASATTAARPMSN